MSIDESSSGEFWGFNYSTSATSWTLQKFDSKAEAYSLCFFQGKTQQKSYESYN